MELKVLFCLTILNCFNNFIFSWDMEIGGKQANFTKFEGLCRGHKDIKIFYDFHSIRAEKSKLFMNSTITVTEDIIAPPSLTLTIKRCRSKENTDVCENFNSFTTKKYCQLIGSGSDLWAPFFGTVEPKWTCPIKKGIYQSTNSVFDLTAFLLFPVDGWYWRARGDLFDSVTGKRIMCIIVEANVSFKGRRQF